MNKLFRILEKFFLFVGHFIYTTYTGFALMYAIVKGKIKRCFGY